MALEGRHKLLLLERKKFGDWIEAVYKVAHSETKKVWI